MNALCIVAHPDDETIWMGGTIMKKKSWNWTIISLCRKSDPDRMPKFIKVCRLYNAESIISDLEDEKLKPLRSSQIIKEISRVLPKKEYDFIFTHGENGEYGHRRHKEIHLAVKKMIKSRKLKPKKTFYFSYDTKDSKAPSSIESDFNVNLTSKELKNKIRVVTRLYGFNPNSFEALSCNKLESFSLK